MGPMIIAQHVVALLAAAAAFTAAYQQGADKPVVDNERVTVWHLTGNASPSATLPAGCVSVRLAPSIDVAFSATCSRAAGAAAAESVVIGLKAVRVPPLANTSGFPNAFPRANGKQWLDNDRVVVWDYTWTTGVPTPMHFHDKDVVVIYLEAGGVKSTTPDGQSVVNEVSRGLIRFNNRERIHTEELVSGKSRAIIVELK